MRGKMPDPGALSAGAGAAPPSAALTTSAHRSPPCSFAAGRDGAIGDYVCAIWGDALASAFAAVQFVAGAHRCCPHRIQDLSEAGHDIGVGSGDVVMLMALWGAKSGRGAQGTT
jgi:hypothetical protein